MIRTRKMNSSKIYLSNVTIRNNKVKRKTKSMDRKRHELKKYD